MSRITYNPRRHGRTSETDPEDDNVREEWEHCHELNDSHGGEGYSWVPTASIYLRDDLQPRIEAGLDVETAERYAEAFDMLPPVLVQRGTLHLIDGRHRIRAAYLANPQRYYIKAVEIDVPDGEMIDHAVRANAGHGRGHTQKERLYWAKDFLRRHSDWTNVRIAEWTGASRMYVIEQRGKLEAAQEIATTTERITKDGGVQKISDRKVPQGVSGLQGAGHESPTPEPKAEPVSELSHSRYEGGKPASFYPVGTVLYDLATDATCALVRKDDAVAVVRYLTGDAAGRDVEVHPTRALRFRQHTGERGERPDDAAPVETIAGFVEPSESAADLVPFEPSGEDDAAGEEQYEQTGEPVSTERRDAIADAIVGLANAIDEQYDPVDVATALDEDTAHWLSSFAPLASRYLATFTDALKGRFA